MIIAFNFKDHETCIKFARFLVEDCGFRDGLQNGQVINIVRHNGTRGINIDFKEKAIKGHNPIYNQTNYRFGQQFTIDMFTNTKIVLADNREFEVSPDGIKCGCTTIHPNKVEELYRVFNNLRKDKPEDH